MKTESKNKPMAEKMKRLRTTGAGKRTHTVVDRFAALTFGFQFVNVNVYHFTVQWSLYVPPV
jgi:hypothetical protein